MRNHAALIATLAIGLHVALAVTASASPLAADPTIGPVCSVTSTVDRDGTRVSITTSDCGADARENHLGLLDRAMAFIFGTPTVTTPSRPVPDSRAIPEIPSIRPDVGSKLPDAPKGGAVERLGLRCTLDIVGAGRMKQVGIKLRSDSDTAVMGMFEVIAENNGIRRIRQEIDTPIRLKVGKDELVVLGMSNVADADRIKGSIVTGDGQRVECDVPK